MTMMETLLKQFDSCYNTNGWFVAVRNAIDGVNAEQAAWKPEGSGNSIWESLTHLTYYNNAYLQRWKGIEFEYDVADNDETFRSGEAAEGAWRAEVEKFDAVMTEWRTLIEQADESKFSEPVPTNTSRMWADLIADVNAHNAYHGGQILLLRKLQGAWNPAKGVS
jgi:uncharacterized damage-inducible protein DinB